MLRQNWNCVPAVDFWRYCSMYEEFLFASGLILVILSLELNLPIFITIVNKGGQESVVRRNTSKY